MATLVDDGKVSWNTLAKNILPGFTMGNNELTSRLTFRHMVCACSGWQGDRSDVFFRTHIPAEEIVRSMGDIPATGEFEKVFIYSNQMVAAAGYLAGYAAGGSQDDFWKGYADAMQTRVFDPLDMDRTTLSLEKVQASGNYALPHGKTLDFTYQAMPLSAENFVIPIAPAGGIWSSAEDMAKILLLEMAGGVSAGGQRVVSQENMVRTWEPQIDMGESGVRYALGWMTEAYLGKTLIHHSGNSMGFSSDLAFIPEASLGMVILSNAEGAGSFTDAVRSRFFELAFGQDPAYDDIFKQRLATDRKSVMDFATILLPKYNPQSVTPYLGEYQNVLLGKIQLKDEAGKLMLHTEAFSSALGQYNGLAKPSLFLLDPPFATVVFWRLELNQDETGEPFIALYENDKTQPMLFVKITGQD
jgi:CubicO group peptidase (beta-lactamase class C family)